MSQEISYKQALQSLTTTISRKISEGVQKIDKSFPWACIYRVPEELRRLNESAYTPRLVSIGPLHSKDKHLKSIMQDIKMSYVNSLLCRITDGSEVCKFAVLQECTEAMKRSLEDAKKRYTDEVDNLNEEMLVVDGCFILELLYRNYLLTLPKEETNEEGNEITNEMPMERTIDPVFDNNLMNIAVQQDLLLLENQLPFFVLEKLFHITVDKIPGRPSNCLFHYVVSYFSNMTMSLKHKSTPSNETNCCSPNEHHISLLGNGMNSENGGGAAPKKYYHILHILLDHCLPLDIPEGKHYSEKMPSASDLDYAGVKFVAGTEQDLVKVNFTYAQSCLRRYLHRAHFEIPPLSLYDSTELFLRNLIAFEQCCPRVSCYFTSYAFLMDMLVNSTKDVEVLQKDGIIQNYLGVDQEASELFNKLCKEVVLEKFLFAETCEQATKYSKLGWPKNVAYVRRKYFATPWTFIAFCVAFIAFVMSLTQFVRSFVHNSSPASLRECFVSRYQLPTGYCYVLNDDLHDQL
ncbi:UPF0481 protein At3g47200-like [Actinidia eriantha]|uniref:UPF0481 protein At3g47200-like n=1 Tax=Actinidia eriantha TaxID=165200 RepID=UPI00258FB9FD|nr:UPF0481 protein At3g47200-like [Actinidia eriantha]